MGSTVVGASSGLEELRDNLTKQLAALLFVAAYAALFTVLRLPFPLGKFSLVIFLLALAVLVLVWLDSHPRLVCHLFVWGLTGALLAGMWLFTAPWLPFVGLILLFIDAVLLPRSELVSAVATSLVAIWLVQSGARDYPLAGVLIGTAFGLAVTELMVSALYTTVDRSWNYYLRGRNLIEQARERQGEHNRAVKELADRNLQLARLNQLAQGLRQTAEDARRAKEQFVANVSHELRTPLNIVLGFSETILQAPEVYGGRIPPTLMADLAVVHRNAEHLSALIDDVLDLSQVEAGRMALTKERVCMSDIVDEAVAIVRPLFDSKGLYLRAKIPEGLSPVLCDRTRIRQVLLNLLSNAGRFTEHGGVEMSASQAGNDIVVTVSDTGSGIAPEDREKIFRPFEQLDGSIRRRHGGTGLGLSISKHFVELHDGKMWFEIQEDVGTTFFFRLPIAPPAPRDGGPLHWLSTEWSYRLPTDRPTAAMPVSPPRLVVLDSGGGLHRLLERYLDDAEIVAVSSLEEALQELSDAPCQALLVNDVSVSQTLEQLRASSVLPSGLPTIICSILGAGDASVALGASDYLVKPVSRDALVDALDRLKLRGKTVLIVDDDPDALQLFGRMLAVSNDEYHTLLARDGREAMRILHEHRPDVMLLDLIMPNMDGFQVLDAVRRDPGLRDIPVILISARDPAGQPIATSAVAITRPGGLSAHQLLKYIAVTM